MLGRLLWKCNRLQITSYPIENVISSVTISINLLSNVTVYISLLFDDLSTFLMNFSTANHLETLKAGRVNLQKDSTLITVRLSKSFFTSILKHSHHKIKLQHIFHFEITEETVQETV